MTRREPPLAGALSLLLPSPSQTLLLRSALLPQHRALSALESWQAGVDDPVAAFAARDTGGRRLAPLIARNLGDNGQNIDSELMTYLRTAAMREELRAREYRKICHGVLASLTEAGLHVIALKGAALAESVYPSPALRHSHDIDLLICEEELELAESVTAGIGFQRVVPSQPSYIASRHYIHDSGLPLDLHPGLFTVGPYNEVEAGARDRAEPCIILSVSVYQLCPADQLLHVCAHAATGWQRSTLAWACDAWLVMNAAPDLDWDVLVESSRQGQMSLPLYVTLSYLAHELEAPIPPDRLEQLRGQAMRTGRVTREVALFGAWAGPSAKLPRALRASSRWRDKALIAGWRLVPSPASVAAAGRIRSQSGWPLWYLGRPFRLLARRLRSLAGRDGAAGKSDGGSSPG